MTYREAANFKIGFGRYKGQSIDEIASSSPGLLWLDWAVGWEGTYESARQFIRRYLDEPTVALELDRAIEDRETHA